MCVACYILLSYRKLTQREETLQSFIFLSYRASFTTVTQAIMYILDSLHTSVSLILYLNLCSFFHISPCHSSDYKAVKVQWSYHDKMSFFWFTLPWNIQLWKLNKIKRGRNLKIKLQLLVHVDDINASLKKINTTNKDIKI